MKTILVMPLVLGTAAVLGGCNRARPPAVAPPAPSTGAVRGIPPATAPPARTKPAAHSGQFPRSPEEGAKSFRAAPGFAVDLIAAEPHLASPVAMTFDADGRIYVAEMLDYPLVRTPGMFGPFPEGQIRLLETNEDGTVVASTVFATAISLPCSVVPYDGGILVAAAPDILFLKDTDGDGHADIRQVVLTGFDDSRDLYRVNSLQWGIDGWIYARGVGNTPVHWGDDPHGAALSTDGMNFRFKPRQKRFEAVSGLSGCFGLTSDDWGRWFFSNSADHIEQVVLPNRYLRRNPYLAAPPLTREISDHGGVTQVFRASEPQAWRVERSEEWAQEGLIQKYFGHVEARQDYTTSTCGAKIYREAAFPPEYRGSYFVCEAVGNLVHRDVLKGPGPVFTARRGEARSEFLASTDPWCCPVFLETGPDGGLYVVDMYRQIIEHPGPDGGRTVPNVPLDILRKYGMRAGSTMGRIYRVRPAALKPGTKPHLSTASPRDLAAALDNPGAWWRTTAQRLILEHPETADRAAIEAVARTSRYPAARVQALWTLEALGNLSSRLIAGALNDPVPGVRENALRLSDDRLAIEPALAAAVVTMTGDPDRSVRFQLAFTLGELKSAERIGALAAIVRRDAADRDLRTAILSSIGGDGIALYRAVSADEPGAGTGHRAAGIDRFRGELAQVIGARLDKGAISEMLTLIDRQAQTGAMDASAAALEGLARGMQRRGVTNFDVPAGQAVLRRLLDSRSEAVRRAARAATVRIRALTEVERTAAVRAAAATVLDAAKPLSRRVEATRVLGSGDFSAVAPVLAQLLDPRQPEPLQVAALQALDVQTDPGVVQVLASRWRELTPAVREQAIPVALGRKNRLAPLLAALQSGAIAPETIDSRWRAQLIGFPDQAIAARARTVFADSGLKIDPGLFDQYKGALALRGDRRRGAATFKKLCTTCHRAGGVGTEIGPNLASVRDHPREQILKDIVYPSLTVQPHYVQYVAETTSGQVFTGLIVSSGATSITLRRPNAEDVTLLRQDVEALTAPRPHSCPRVS